MDRSAAIRKFSTSRSSLSSPTINPSNSATASTSGSGGGTASRKSLPGPATPSHFVSVLAYHVLKKPLFVDINLRVGIYLCLASAGSVVFDFIKLPPSYFSNKFNFPNQFFVKWGWGWSFCFLTVFMILTSFVYCGGSKARIRLVLLRLLVGSFWWYVLTNLFHFVENTTGRCHPGSVLAEGASPLERRGCNRAGGMWLGFDISGHAFLLVLNNLWIVQEAGVMRHWTRLGTVIGSSETTDSADPNVTEAAPNVSSQLLRQVTPAELIVMRSSYRRLTGSIKATAVCLALLSLLWDFMFLCTVIYFHNMPSKFTAVLLAVLCWYLSYRVWFPMKHLSPGLPGDGLVKFTNT